MLRITPEIESLIDRALTEDLSIGDPTCDALIPPELQGRAAMVAKSRGVLAGLDVALAVFSRVDPALKLTRLKQDGDALRPDDVIAIVSGSAASIMMAERTALNFAQRMSGIATAARAYVDAVAGHRARIVDTRKTTPGLRTLEKYAVRCGGAHNHRRNLGDGILIKDNHIQALREQGMSLADVVKRPTPARPTPSA